MKQDPLQTQRKELSDYQKKYKKADPSDYRKDIYKKENDKMKGDEGNRLFIIPNPSNSTTEIRYNLAESSSEIIILDMFQRTIDRHVPTAKRGTFNVNVDSWQSGMYFVYIKQSDNIVLVEKLIVY
jgi:hypothetical protein